MQPAAHPKLLILDDEREILVALEDLFEDDYHVLTCNSPQGALDLLADHPDVAVIISDQRMPEMPGNEFLAKARKLVTSDAILLTGYADLSAVVSAVNEGAITAYVHKPWEAEALRATVDAAAERYRLRQALAFERAAFAALAERSTVRVTILDRAGQVVRGNAVAAFCADCDDAAADRAALDSGDYTEHEARHRDTEGEDRWILTRRVPFGTDEQRHLLKLESDVTEHHRAQAAAHQSEKLQALGTLAGGIAHDFNNLLAVIVGNLELAERNRDDAARLDRYLANAADAAARGGAISRRLLAFSRQRDLAARTLSAVDAIRDVEDLIVRSMAGRVQLHMAFADDTGSIHVDPGQFELAIVNLCINARDAMPEGGDIRIGVRDATEGELPEELAGPHVVIAVADNGAGMSRAVQARVFEPFFTTKPQGEGTGLGLPMVRAMAQAANGSVTIDSREGEGTTVSLWLPRAGVVEDAAKPVERSAGHRALSVLLVEDDPAVAAILTEHLENAGHRVTSDRGAREALARLDETRNAYDLLLTDHAMPGMSGLSLAQEAARRWPELPIVLATGFADFSGERPASMTVLTKPFGSADLAGALAEAVA